MFVDTGNLLSTLFDMGLFLFGVFSIGVGIQRLLHQVHLKGLPRTATGDVTDSGEVAVQGIIQGPVDSALESPFQQTRGVLTKWQITEFVGHELGTGHHWWEWGEGYESVPFIMDDGSGPVRVEISGDEELNALELDLSAVEDEPVLEIDVSESPPAHVREFIETREIREQQSESSIPAGDSEQGDRRYFEQTLSTGDTVYVAGYATSDAGDGSIPTITVSETSPFYLSDRQRADALTHRLKYVVFYFLFGGCLIWYTLGQLTPGINFI